MFTLVTDRSRYFRVRRQSAEEIEQTFKAPVLGKVFAGAIICLPEKPLKSYTASVGDTYRTIAEKLGAGEEELKRINGFKPVYPTCKLFVP